MIAQLLAQTAPEDAPIDRSRIELRADAALRVTRQAPTAAKAISTGELQAGFEALKSYAETNTADAAQAWRDLGILAYDREPAIALEAYRRAVSIDPDNFDAWFNLANLEFEQAGDTAAAIAAVGGASEAAQTDLDRFRAIVLGAEFERALGNMASAKAGLQKAISGYRLLLAETPADDRLRHGLSDALWELSNIELNTGNRNAASPAAEEVLAISRARFNDDRSDLDRQLDLATALESVGAIALDRGDLRAAEQAFAESLALDRDRQARAPESLRAQRDLTISLERYGDILDALGRPDEAVIYFRESVQVSRLLAARAPSHVLFLEDLANGIALLGWAELDLDNRDAAAAAFVEANRIYRGLSNADPDDPGLLLSVAITLCGLAEANKTGDDTGEIGAILAKLDQASVNTDHLRDDLDELRAWLAGEPID